MLETTFKMEFAPGTNLTGGLASAAWRFLLPDLRWESVVCFEPPPLPTLEVLAQHTEKLIVLSAQTAKLAQLQQQANRPAACAWHFLSLHDLRHQPFAPASIDLLVLAGRSSLEVVARQPGLLKELPGLLKPRGAIFFETRTLQQRRHARRFAAMLRKQGFAAPQAYWVTPLHGELRTAFPAGDEKMTQYLLRHVLFGQSFQKQAASRMGIWLSRARLFSRCAPRRAVIVQREAAAASRQTPRFLTKIAGNAGIALERHRCGLSARGKYNSNKTIFYLFEEHSAQANVVAKMTRAPEFNARLENEYRVLALLEEKELVARHTYPVPLFFGYHAGLALVGQRAVHGEPFRSRTLATATCPIAGQAIAWLADLARRERQRKFATGTEVAEQLGKLSQRFNRIYAFDPATSALLREQIGLFANCTRPFPLVFQHGDPGTWNMLVSRENQIIVIDWEAGEPQGMPLWDLYYFIRSFGNWCARQQGVRNTLRAFEMNFITSSHLSTLLLQTVEKYCADLGLERRLAGPLLLTCWMHRALKEAARLSPAQLQNGHYYNLLRLCMAQYRTSALQALWT